ncbi:MAG: hypothetical protein FJZ92_06385 [Chloroflexi bacterium]|nr:hypothetical protein [Chloroflexota bacterium]
MDRDRRLVEETAIAFTVMLAIAVIVAALFWALTGISPWPYVVLAEVAGVGWGTAMLALSSPARRR